MPPRRTTDSRIGTMGRIAPAKSAKVCWLGFVLAGFTACHSITFGPYTSPRISGWVLNAETHKPLAGVKVNRDKRPRSNESLNPPKQGELLLDKPAVVTDGAGQFTFQSERALTIFRPSGWNFVELTFERSGYERYQTNYSILTAGTNTASGEPLLETGDILMQPTGE